jgi:hypothetical protein
MTNIRKTAGKKTEVICSNFNASIKRLKRLSKSHINTRQGSPSTDRDSKSDPPNRRQDNSIATYIYFSAQFIYKVMMEDLPLSAAGDFIQRVPQLKAVSSLPSEIVTRRKQRLMGFINCNSYWTEDTI